MTLKRKAAITGIGEMKPTRTADGKTTLGIWSEVSRQAILDASLTLQEIDGLRQRQRRHYERASVPSAREVTP